LKVLSQIYLFQKNHKLHEFSLFYHKMSDFISSLYKYLIFINMLNIGISNNNYIINSSEKVKKTNWFIVNDDVMGGISNSSIEVNKKNNLIFQGNISLKNNGGFASCRKEFNFKNLPSFDSFELKIKGDGKTYKLILRTYNSSVYYSVDFKTNKNKLTTEKIALKKFKPFYRGREITKYENLKIDKIKLIGFQISDKQEGSFSLEILSLNTIQSK
tara:strand:+ start:1438 stop:2082 length:645 start_codon:yes stop_codon:yes gene_type:complete